MALTAPSTPIAGRRANGGPLQKAAIVNTATNQAIQVQFNPEEYTLNRENNFAQAAVPGLSGPLLQFVHGNLKTLDMELFVDTYEDGRDVRVLTARIVDLMDIDPRLHAPPILLFTWGPSDPDPNRHGAFTCVLSKVSQRFILFRPDGTPARARLQVTFSEYTDASTEPLEIKRETADYTKHHVVSDGETLSDIAARLYDDPARWRPIAIANGIDHPLRLGVGQRLLIPALPFHDPDSGEVIA
jgi:nucleoid-associated protein YgaU